MIRFKRERLSNRQAQIAALVVRGKSNREIAGLLDLSRRTVETHVATIFSKMGVRSRVELTVALLGGTRSSEGPDWLHPRMLDPASNNDRSR
jgi:DNA-binding NarL/FixJ family response regulator